VNTAVAKIRSNPSLGWCGRPSSRYEQPVRICASRFRASSAVTRQQRSARHPSRMPRQQGVLRLTFCRGEAASQRLVYLQWPCQPRQGCQHHHQHHPPSSWCHCTDGMLLGAGVRALATPGPSPRAEMASAPAMVAWAIAFFAFIRKPLKRLFVFDGPRWGPRFRLTQTESARHPEG
jgi:hypothetical protein